MDFLSGRRALIVAVGVMTVAAAGGIAAALRAPDGGTAALAPLGRTAPTVVAPSPTPSPTLSPTPSPSVTPSPTQTSPRTPTRTPVPSRTALPTPSATRPAAGMALVVIRNTSTVTADVTINGGHWVLAPGTTRTVEAKPEGAGHDEIQVKDADHDGCGMGDSDWYLRAGTTSTLSITPQQSCYQGDQLVASLTWAMSPDVAP